MHPSWLPLAAPLLLCCASSGAPALHSTPQRWTPASLRPVLHGVYSMIMEGSLIQSSRNVGLSLDSYRYDSA